jgi:osmoprotectant transport system substrate-binding protein
MCRRPPGRAPEMAALRILGLAVAVTLAFALGACGGGGDAATTTPAATATVASGPPIRIGTKDFTEQFILGEIYAQALRAKGFRVELKPNIGSSEIVHQALDSGALDMYPDYVGILLSEVADMPQRPHSPAVAYRQAKKFEEHNGFTLLAPTPFSDANALAVKPSYARRYGVRSIADLKRARPRIGAPKEFRTRFEGLIGLRELYGIRKPRFVPLEGSERYPWLDSGRVDVTIVFTTERQLAGGRYTVLKDPRGVFATQHVAPVISRKALDAHGPRLRAAIDAVSATLTTNAMRAMNGAVDIDKRTPRAVATQFLREQGLL